tara:strand:- start:458 stop:790 length:333 start_codon:yes stop_codon:yes gene_type:complete
MRCLTIHIHALNEEEYISKMVKELLPVAQRELDRFELILVNDGSTDNTENIAEILEYNGSVLCELIMDRDEPNIPKSAPRKLSDGSIVRTNFEDLFPFLSEEEIKNNMLT